MSYLLVVGDERVAWALSASAEVGFYETADGLDPVDVLTNIIGSVDASEARLLVTDDGPAAEGLAAKLAGTIGWVATTTVATPADSNIIPISPDATPETISAALGLVYVPRTPPGHETPTPPEPVAARAPQPPAEPERTPQPPLEPDHNQARPKPPWQSPQPATETTPFAPPGPNPTAPQMPAPAGSRPPVAHPIADPPEDDPWRPPQHPPAAAPAAPSDPSRPAPQMPWQPQPEPSKQERGQPPVDPPEPPRESEPTLSEAPLGSGWKGLSTLDDPSYGDAPWAAQTGRSPGDPRGQVIVVASGKGGVGKSTMSMWLTEALTQLGHGAVLVDANIGQSDISKMGQIWTEAPGLSTLIGRPRLSAAEVLKACARVQGLGPVLAAPRESALLDLDAALEALEQAIRALAAERPFVIVDGPVGTPLEPIYNKVLLRLSDKMLMVMAGHEPTLHDCHNWLTSISKPLEEGGSNWDPTRTVAVVNKYDRSDGISEAQIASLFEGLALCSPVPDVEATRMMNRGRWRCPTEAADAVMEVVEIVTGIVVDGPPSESRKSLMSRLLRRG